MSIVYNDNKNIHRVFYNNEELYSVYYNGTLVFSFDASIMYSLQLLYDIVYDYSDSWNGCLIYRYPTVTMYFKGLSLSLYNPINVDSFKFSKVYVNYISSTGRPRDSFIGNSSTDSSTVRDTTLSNYTWGIGGNKQWGDGVSFQYNNYKSLPIFEYASMVDGGYPSGRIHTQGSSTLDIPVLISYQGEGPLPNTPKYNYNNSFSLDTALSPNVDVDRSKWHGSGTDELTQKFIARTYHP